MDQTGVEPVSKSRFPLLLLSQSIIRNSLVKETIDDLFNPVVPYTQMEKLYQKLKGSGTDVSACYVDGAEHEGNFWSPEVRQTIHSALYRFLNCKEAE